MTQQLVEGTFSILIIGRFFLNFIICFDPSQNSHCKLHMLLVSFLLLDEVVSYFIVAKRSGNNTRVVYIIKYMTRDEIFWSLMHSP